MKEAEKAARRNHGSRGRPEIKIFFFSVHFLYHIMMLPRIYIEYSLVGLSIDLLAVQCFVMNTKMSMDVDNDDSIWCFQVITFTYQCQCRCVLDTFHLNAIHLTVSISCAGMRERDAFICMYYKYV